MTLYIEPDFSVPVPGSGGGRSRAGNIYERLVPLVATIHMLSLHGMDLEVTPDDEDAVRGLILSYAENPDKVDKVAVPAKLATMTPASLLLTESILREFSHQVVEDATQIRLLVTNRLINETDNPDSRIRLKALELLGKISDVGLFSEKSEVTVTHKTSDELRERLREKLEKMAAVNDVLDAEDAEVIEPLDASEEFGFDG